MFLFASRAQMRSMMAFSTTALSTMALSLGIAPANRQEMS
jgi:hypothetical protein